MTNGIYSLNWKRKAEAFKSRKEEWDNFLFNSVLFPEENVKAPEYEYNFQDNSSAVEKSFWSRYF